VAGGWSAWKLVHDFKKAKKPVQRKHSSAKAWKILKKKAAQALEAPITGVALSTRVQVLSM